MIESRIRNRKKQSTALLGLNWYSLEHIMPKKWMNHWEPVAEAEQDKRNKKLLTLGNLTIITSSLNTSISIQNYPGWFKPLPFVAGPHGALPRYTLVGKHLKCFTGRQAASNPTALCLLPNLISSTR